MCAQRLNQQDFANYVWESGIYLNSSKNQQNALSREEHLRFVYVFVFFKNIHFKSLEAAGIMYLQSTILREVKILMHYFSLVIMSI